MKTSMENAGAPWPSRAGEEVSSLRGAITAHLDEPMINSSAAPMMGELLTRLEGFSDPRDVADLRPPMTPAGVEPLSQSEAQAMLQHACTALRQRVAGGADDPQTSQNVREMVEVIDDHLSMKGEVLARATSDATPG